MPIILLLLLSTLLQPQKDTATEPPDLGTPVAKVIAAARHGPENCLTAASRLEPCAQIVSEHVAYIVAWDKTTNRVTYVFTSDLSFVTDGELGVGGTLRVDRRNLVTYKDWLIAPDSAETANGEGGGNKWYPVVTPLDQPSSDANKTYASISGFVQSEYLNAILQKPPAKTTP